MMTYYAQTEIRYGTAEGETVIYDHGEEVSEGDFDEASWAQMVEAGSIAETPPDEGVETMSSHLAAKDAEIARLQAALDVAEGRREADPEPETEPADEQ